jgi:hypothetical protein
MLSPRATADAGTLPDGTPLGIGGAYTLSVSGPYVTYRDPSPSGITVFPGIPVEVTVSGQITRQMTDGFIHHCEIVPEEDCPDFVRSNAPFGPGGLAFTNLGAATSWWDYFFGWYYYVVPGGSVVYRGPSGTNLLIGRTGLYCTWGHVFPGGEVEQGDCYTLGGGFTFTVHTMKTPPDQAGLTLAITKNRMGPSGGPVDLTAATTDGSQATDLTWYFIADNVTQETDPAPEPSTSESRSIAAPTLGASRSLSASPSGARFPAPGQRVRAINGRTGEETITTDIHTLPPGGYVFLSADSTGVGVPGENAAASFAPASVAASRKSISPSVRMSSSDEPITGSATLDACAGSLTCTANLHVAGGTFVVTGIVHGVLRAAEQRVAALPEDPGPPGPDVTISIVRAEGPNEKSFTLAPDERKIVLEAAVSPADLASAVVWEVIDAPDDRVAAIPPTPAPTGQLTSFLLPRHLRSRWPTDHPGAMDRKTIRYQVTATVTKDGKVYRSDPVIASQDLVDTIREEYYEFGLDRLGRHIPARGAFTPSAPVPTGQAGDNNGDYPLAVINPAFATKLAALKTAWKGQWQVNTIYRNPVHNLNGHIPNQTSAPSPVSWHMWGCAADLQTYPTGTTAKEKAARLKFWTDLSNLAKDKGWDVEPFDASTVSHVHVELDCP